MLTHSVNKANYDSHSGFIGFLSRMRLRSDLSCALLQLEEQDSVSCSFKTAVHEPKCLKLAQHMQRMTVFTVAAVMFSHSALNLSRFAGKID